MNNIKAVLKRQGRTIQWLSDQIDRSYNMTHQYVTNKRQPSLELLFNIAELLNVSAKDLIVERK